jgi:glycerol-3-phosphate acyltransferase PlsY
MSAGGVVAAGLVGYLSGSFPTADLVARIATRGTVNLRAVGSGNPGATNAAAVLGRRWGAVVLLGDLVKGVIAVAVGTWCASDTGAYVAGAAAVAGHIVPPWSRFQGGKGVATSAGTCLMLFPAFFPVALGVAVLGAVARRRAEVMTWVSGALWVLAAALWWAADLANAWGPAPGAGLVAWAAVSVAMIVAKFAIARRAVAPEPTDR